MNVYLLIHDEGGAGDSVRAVYLSREAAEASLVTRTASGQRSRAWAAHDENCCSIDEREVEDAPSIDVREDDPPMTGSGLIPDALRDSIFDLATRANPYSRVLR